MASSGVAALRRTAQRILQTTSTRPLVAGQPTPITHPELLQPGEVIPGLSAAEFAHRRQRLSALLPSDSIANLPSAPKLFMVGVIPYPFRQDADFFYLTGITTPMSVAVVQGGGTGHMTTFVPNLDTWVEQWDGARLSPEASCDYFGSEGAYPRSEMP